MKKILFGAAALAVLSLSAQAESVKAVPFDAIKDGLSATEFRQYGATSPASVSTRLGDLTFTVGGFAGGYPTKDAIEKLQGELAFQKACQAYLWAVPLVSYTNWFDAHRNTFGAKDGDIVQYKTIKAKQGILTGNGTTPYAISFANLEKTGPLVLEVPEGPSAGVIDDMFQRAVKDFGVSGDERGKGATFLIIAPGMEAPENYDKKKYVLVQNTTKDVFFGIRALQPDPEEADIFLKKFKIYPYSKADNPPETKFIVVDDKTPWGQWQQHGMAYWETVKQIVDHESFGPREGYILAMLESLGIEKGKPFKPTDAQKKLLKEAAVVGEAMTKSITFDKPFANNDLYKGTHWDQLMVPNFDDRDGDIEQMYRRAAFTWEAVSRGKAYYLEVPGIGQQYRTGYKDADGNPLVGNRHYTLTMPPNPPAKTFWSAVIYDVNTRTMLINKSANPIASSRTNLQQEADGSVVLHFSPEKPRDVEDSNWLQTNPEESWFIYLRFYGPTEAYFDESYPLQDVTLVND